MTAARAHTPPGAEIRLASRPAGEGLRETIVSLPTIHCGGCIQRIEKALGGLSGIERARVNLSTKRVSIAWRDTAAPPAFMETLDDLGYDAVLFDAKAEDDKKDPVHAELIRALAVAGFAAMNIMFLSVGVWSGADADTRQLFHWISALIAFPALAYSGRVFYRSAWNALRHFRTNMDVPISIGVTLAYAMSLFDTIHGNHHAYFDAATMLLFFLLIGRTLDHMMRERARTAVKGLARLVPRGAWVRDGEGRKSYVPVSTITPGMTVLIAAGERVPVDARVVDGVSDLDCAVVSGESTPRTVRAGAVIESGALNLTGPITVVATSTADNSFLAEMMRMMEAAEEGRTGYRRLADRAARLYAPLVHTAALVSFIGWMLATGDWHRATTIAIAVLIITCPCALALAVPMVQVVAARRLFEQGIMVRDGSAMERLGDVDAVLFDKTGTLTLGALRLRNRDAIDPRDLAMAAALASHSRHPHSVALAAERPPERSNDHPVFEDMRECPGLGVEARLGDARYRLGRAEWAISEHGGNGEAAGTVLSRDGVCLARFEFDDRLRPGAAAAVNAFSQSGMSVEIISGDAAAPVAEVAEILRVRDYTAAMMPGEKVTRLETHARAGRKTLMVGDGLNDAPALAAAHVSMAPATAADVGRNAADFVFLRESLDAVPVAFAISRDARHLIRQNFMLAAIYNVIALPVAVLGLVTPLIAAVAMSLSSILVVANALRLGHGKPARQTDAAPTPLRMEGAR